VQIHEALVARIQYYRRVAGAYLLPGTSQLTFWHDTPVTNSNTATDRLGPYYMLFAQKADYSGPHDANGIPLLDYHGRIGLQHNPIAIAQWGLGNHSLYCRSGDPRRKEKFLAASDWLCQHLQPNRFGIPVWNHNFDWEYRTPLRAPWYSGLAQGQGISLLVRAHAATQDPKYLHTSARAFESFLHPVEAGGVAFTDVQGDVWFEEYIVLPPTHILNGFLWACWGVYDYFLATANAEARDLFARAVATLKNNLPRYDLGFWSLYEQSGTRLPMVASPFYHRLHVTQLRVMYELTGERIFSTFANRWEGYARDRGKRARALCYKGAFKLGYY